MAKVKLGIAETAAQFEIVHSDKVVERGFYGHFGEIDFTRLTIAQAQNLLQFGFPYLRRKTTATVSEVIKSPVEWRKGKLKAKKN
jgi:hypothetical protein